MADQIEQKAVGENRRMAATDKDADRQQIEACSAIGDGFVEPRETRPGGGGDLDIQRRIAVAFKGDACSPFGVEPLRAAGREGGARIARVSGRASRGGVSQFGPQREGDGVESLLLVQGQFARRSGKRLRRIINPSQCSVLAGGKRAQRYDIGRFRRHARRPRLIERGRSGPNVRRPAIWAALGLTDGGSRLPACF